MLACFKHVEYGHVLVQMVAMGDVSATETAVVYGLEPVWGAAFAWFLLGERWDNTALIGAALVLCKLVFLSLVLCHCMSAFAQP